MDYKNLNFDIHPKLVERKIVYAVGILNKLKCYLPKKILLQLYHALIYPHLLYAIHKRGSTYKSYLHKISILQNKAVRIGYPHKMEFPPYTQFHFSHAYYLIYKKSEAATIFFIPGC